MGVASGEVAGQMGKARGFQNKREDVGAKRGRGKGHLGVRRPRVWSRCLLDVTKRRPSLYQDLCFFISISKGFVLMSFEVFSALKFFEISACVRTLFISALYSFCPSPWQFASRWKFENNFI